MLTCHQNYFRRVTHWHPGTRWVITDQGGRDSVQPVPGAGGSLKDMRGLYLGLAALFCVVAIALNFLDTSRILSIIALLVAGVFLVLGLRVTAERREPDVIKLDGEREETIRTMIAEGRDTAAISQVQLWFRNTTPEQARQVVESLRATQS